MRLYEISGAICAIEDAIIASDGEITDEIAAQLDAMEGTFESKIESVAFAIRNMKTQADAARYEEQRIAALRKARDNGAARLTGYLQTCMEIAHRDKVDTPVFAIALQKSPPSVTVADVERLPAEFQRVIPQTIEADKKALLAAYKAGAALPDGVTITESHHVRIR